MKKNYISPAIETLEVNTAFAICGNSPGGSSITGGNNSFGAPKRRKPF